MKFLLQPGASAAAAQRAGGAGRSLTSVFLLHQVVERLELSALEQGYVEEGRRGLSPCPAAESVAYAYVLGLTSARRLHPPAGRLGLPAPGGWGHTGFSGPSTSSARGMPGR